MKILDIFSKLFSFHKKNKNLIMKVRIYRASTGKWEDEKIIGSSSVNFDPKFK